MWQWWQWFFRKFYYLKKFMRYFQKSEKTIAIVAILPCDARKVNCLLFKVRRARWTGNYSMKLIKSGCGEWNNGYFFSGQKSIATIATLPCDATNCLFIFLKENKTQEERLMKETAFLHQASISSLTASTSLNEN